MKQFKMMCGAMFSGNTESGISVTYDDASNKVNFSVGSVTNSMLSGSIANSKLANSSITFGAGTGAEAIALGGTLNFDRSIKRNRSINKFWRVQSDYQTM